MELTNEQKDALYMRLVQIPEGMRLMIDSPELFMKYAAISDAFANLHTLSTENAFRILLRIGAISDDGVPGTLILQSLKDLAPGLEG